MFRIYSLFVLDTFASVLYMTIQTRHVLSLDGSYFLIGLLGSVTALLTVFWRPVVGHISDRKKKKQVVIWCLLLSLFGNTISWLSTSLYIFFISRLICVASSPVQTLLRTIITDVTTNDEEASKAFNKISAISPLGMLAGVVIGGHVSDYANAIDYGYFMILGSIVFSTVVSSTLPDVNKTQKKESKATATDVQGILQELLSTNKDLKRLATSTRFWDVFAMKMLLSFSFCLYHTNIGLLLREDLKVSDKYISYGITITMLASVIANLLLSKIKSKLYPTDKGYVRVKHFSLVQVCVFAAMFYVSNLGVVMACMITLFCCQAALDSALNDLLLSRTEAGEKGMVFATYDNVPTVVQILGPVSSGAFAQAFGIRSVFAVCAAVVFANKQLVK